MFNLRSFFSIKIKREKSSPVTSIIKYSSCGTNIYCIMSIAESLLGIGVDKTRNTEHSGTCRNIPEHEKIKIIFMKKNNNKNK